MSNNATVDNRAPQAAAPEAAGRRNRPGVTTAVGGFYVCMAGVNAGFAIADAEVYRHFADRGLFGFVRTGWTENVMANPSAWAALLAAGEACIGVALLVGGVAARWGWVSVLAFHILLLLFGWGVWVYGVPAIITFTLMARHDWGRLSGSSP